MSCPVCGGTERDPLAPGLWRCSSLTTVVTEVGGPGLANPALGPGVIRRTSQVLCGTEYPEAGAQQAEHGLVCRCGTFAIGRCTECGDPVCGFHSDMVDGVRLCELHVQEERAAAAMWEREREAKRARRAEEVEKGRIASWQSWARTAKAQLASVADPSERFVRLAAALDGAKELDQWGPLVLPEIWVDYPRPTGPITLKWPWDDRALERWFLQHVKVPPIELACHRRKREFLSSRTKTVEFTRLGWEFESTRGAYAGDSRTQFLWWEKVRIYAEGGGDFDELKFGVGALQDMAKLTEVPPIARTPIAIARDPR